MQQQSPRPPPPEYKMNPSGGPPLQNMMPPHLQNVLMQQRFGTVPPHQRPRPPMQQQPMPPSGPMMRPQQHGNGSNPLLQQSPHLTNAMQGGPAAQRMYIRSQRPPNITPTEALTPSAEWRHMMAVQQQAQQQQAGAAGPNGYRTGGGVPANFQQMQGVMYNSGGNPGLQLSSMQMQQLPTSRSNNSLPNMHHQSMSMQHSTAQMNLNLQMSQQASMQQQANMNNFNPGAGGGRNNPAQSNAAPSPQQQQQMNQQMSQQNQAMSQQQQQMSQHMSNFSYQAQQHSGGFMQQYMSHQQQSSNSTPCSVSSGLNGLPSDFNLDFLDGPVTSSDSSFNDQDILRSLESGASFNLQDIL
uniref:Uncharacterized protein n=1 Tax=Cacopsylla melanoneura TaxID=428564 RepID=A0A8D9ADH8_9HEMI